MKNEFSVEENNERKEGILYEKELSPREKINSFFINKLQKEFESIEFSSEQEKIKTIIHELKMGLVIHDSINYVKNLSLRKEEEVDDFVSKTYESIMDDLENRSFFLELNSNQECMLKDGLLKIAEANFSINKYFLKYFNDLNIECSKEDDVIEELNKLMENDDQLKNKVFSELFYTLGLDEEKVPEIDIDKCFIEKGSSWSFCISFNDMEAARNFGFADRVQNLPVGYVRSNRESFLEDNLDRDLSIIDKLVVISPQENLEIGDDGVFDHENFHVAFNLFFPNSEEQPEFSRKVYSTLIDEYIAFNGTNYSFSLLGRN